MRLGLFYTYFDGFNQLVESINFHSQQVNEIVVCYQQTSNTGNKRVDVLEEIKELKRMFPNVYYLHFAPSKLDNTKENERSKHELMISKAKELKCSHFILSACDHFYTKEAFDYAKNIKADVILTQMFTYYKQKSWRIEPPESYYMPFIHKLYENTHITKANVYRVVTDPSVRVNTCKRIHIAPLDKCALHHYSMIRNDIELKFRNSASFFNWDKAKVERLINEYKNAKVGDKLEYFSGAQIVECSEIMR